MGTRAKMRSESKHGDRFGKESLADFRASAFHWNKRQSHCESGERKEKGGPKGKRLLYAVSSLKLFEAMCHYTKEQEM